MDEFKIVYSGKDFFGYLDTYMTSTCYYPNKKDIQKAVSQLKKDRHCAIQFIRPDHVAVSILWDSFDDFDSQIVKINESPEWNITNVRKVSFELAKKYIIENLTREDAA